MRVIFISGLTLGALIALGQEVCLAEHGEEPPSASVAANSNDNSNPYSMIARKNVFKLNPPPPTASADKGPAPDLPKVSLSGFMRVGADVNVLFVIKTKGAGSQSAEKTSYLNLAQGQKRDVGLGGSVELVKIYASLDKVDIINSGTPATLSLKEDGVKAEPGSLKEGGVKAERGMAPAAPTPAILELLVRKGAWPPPLVRPMAPDRPKYRPSDG